MQSLPRKVALLSILLAFCVNSQGLPFYFDPLGQFGASSFIPSQISGLALWFDASDASTITIGGGTSSNVCNWASKSGGYNGTNSTAGKYPVYEPSIANGKPAIRFDGGDNLIHGYLLTNNSSFTCFAVYKSYVTNAQNRSLLYARQPCMISTLADVGTGSGTWGTYAGKYISSGYYANDLFIGSITLKYFNNIDLSYNGLLVTRTDGTSFLQPGTYGNLGSYSGTTDYFNGYVCEIILYPFAVTTSQRQEIELYLSRKWGVSITQ